MSFSQLCMVSGQQRIEARFKATGGTAVLVGGGAHWWTHHHFDGPRMILISILAQTMQSPRRSLKCARQFG